jgi:hypothetical protein
MKPASLALVLTKFVRCRGQGFLLEVGVCATWLYNPQKKKKTSEISKKN